MGRPPHHMIMTRSWWDADGNCMHWEVVPESEWRAPYPPPEETMDLIHWAARSVCQPTKDAP